MIRDDDKDFFRGPDGTKYYFDDISNTIASKHPDLVGKHIFLQLDAAGLRPVFERGTTPYVLPYSFSPEEFADITITIPTPHEEDS